MKLQIMLVDFTDIMLGVPNFCTYIKIVDTCVSYLVVKVPLFYVQEIIDNILSLSFYQSINKNN